METKSIEECLELQLTELEMLSSMYPRSEEFSGADPMLIAHVRNYISGISEVKPKQFDYSLYLDLPNIQEKLEVIVDYPHNYPDVNPAIHTRSEALSRGEQTKLNSAITDYLESNPSKGELCILLLINWLSENANKYFSQIPVKNTLKTQTDNEDSGNKDTFSRLWIYSHHIYNKDKRKDILSLGKDLNLSGFSLPGKPGVICVEGYSEDCQNFLQNVKQMSWKKLSLNQKELIKLNGKSIDKLRNFDSFQELNFQVRRGPAREYHMDMGEFYKYLESHNCGYAFELIFGFEGHVAEQN